jgi:hypothetical protein
MLYTPSQGWGGRLFSLGDKKFELDLRLLQRQLRTQDSGLLPEGVMLMAKTLCSASSATVTQFSARLQNLLRD